jgi:aldose 1-epimerase
MPELPAVTLTDPSSKLTAQFVPAAGMIGTSLSEDGVELLGQRRGLNAYVTTGKTMGIPILYPWANRLSANNYAVDGGIVTLVPGVGGVRTDEHGVPIHGVLAAYPGWQITEQSENRLTAELDFAATPRLLAYFPYPHMLTLDVELSDRALSVRTTVRPTTSAPVPLCFGFHPYFQIPEVPRAQWQIETPAMRHLLVDAWGLPTGASQPHPAAAELLRDKVFDNGYDEVPQGSVFAVSGGNRRIEVVFDEGFPAAQIFAPTTDNVVCFEPMAAPTDALRRRTYRVATEKEPATAAFTIRVFNK